MRLKAFFIFIFFLLICVYHLQEYTPVFASDRGSYTFYLGSKSSSAKTVTASAVDAKKTAKQLDGITGEKIFFEDKTYGENYALKIVKNLNAKKVFSERVENTVCEYYYTPKIYCFVLIKNKRVNLHVVKSVHGVSVATPLVFDGY